WRNRFNYMAGRWVQISGMTQKPDLSKMRGWVIRTDYAPAGGFECDDPKINALYAATNWTFENVTLGGMLVDCPHRERRGYGDGFGVTRMAFDNYELPAFYTKWAEDWRDVARPTGEVPYTAPTVVGGGGPAWSGFCVSLPWEIYKRYGDREVLESGGPEIKAWLAFLESKSKDNLLLRYGGRWSFLGDWQWPGFWPERTNVEKQKKAMGDTPEALFFNNCYWIYNLQTAAKIADTLGDTSSADSYRSRAAVIRRAVHSTFFKPSESSYVNGYSAYLAIALLVDLPPADQRAAVWARLEREILQTRKGHIWSGIIGGGLLFETLLDARRDDLIYAMATKTDYPSWTDMLARGGGTFHEDWDGRGTRLHDSMLYIGGWFIEGLGGIRQSDSAYKRFVIQPWITRDAGPKWVNAHYDSPYGRIAIRWKKHGGDVDLHLEVPPGAEGSLRLPAVGDLREGNHLLPVSDVVLVAGTYDLTGVLK
ncbi:MAG: cslA 6, partial [Phycisphaerales bacterium]|nr:cslA 6 [Phycisphaerales bacterium]